MLSLSKGECLIHPLKLYKKQQHSSTGPPGVVTKTNPAFLVNAEGPTNHIEEVEVAGLSPELSLGKPPSEADEVSSELSNRIAALELAFMSFNGTQPKEPEPSHQFQNPYPIFKRVSGAFRTRGPGYNTDYGTLSTLISPDYQLGKAFPLFDLRGHALLNGQWAANIGLGFRIVPHRGCMIFGMNAFYDYRTNAHGNFNQFGLGFELLSQRWGLHFNGYLPFDGHKHSKKHVYDDYIGDYRVTCRRPDYAFDSFNLGVDFELIHQGIFFVFGELSPYYFSSKHHGKHSVGIMAGLRPQFGDYLAIDLNISHDSIFGTIYQAAATLTFPLYQFTKQKGGKSRCLSNRVIYQPIQRNELIPLKKGCCHYHASF